MDDREWLAGQFEALRPRLQSVAYSILGSMSDAEDAVQECWLRLDRSDASNVNDLQGWLTTVVGRICLDMLRRRRNRARLPGGGQDQQQPRTAGHGQPGRDRPLDAVVPAASPSAPRSAGGKRRPATTGACSRYACSAFATPDLLATAAGATCA